MHFFICLQFLWVGTYFLAQWQTIESSPCGECSDGAVNFSHLVNLFNLVILKSYCHHSSVINSANNMFSSFLLFVIYLANFTMCGGSVFYMPLLYLNMQNLIDLAGSESSKAETTGIRRKEGSYINKSLLTLGTVSPSPQEFLWNWRNFYLIIILSSGCTCSHFIWASWRDHILFVILPKRQCALNSFVKCYFWWLCTPGLLFSQGWCIFITELRHTVNFIADISHINSTS